MKWIIGDVEILQLVEMEGGQLIQSTIQQATPESIKHIDWLYPNFANEQGHFTSLVQSFLIKSEDKHILIDTGNGNGKNRPTCPAWGNLHTDFLHNFGEIGIKESDIDIVLSTHLHFDHVGWNTHLQNDTRMPTFPNGTYLFVKEEYDYWQQKPEKEVADDKLAFDDSVVPIVTAGLAKFIPNDYVIDRNVRLIPTSGHTPNHVSIAIASQNKKAIISGDVLHHPCQIAHPDWTMDADTLPDKAFETRKKLLEDIAGTDTLLIGTHFANHVAGYIKSANGGFIFAV